jgi:hypothetical protein
MEDMGAVLVNRNAVQVIGMAVSTNLVALLDDKATEAMVGKTVGEDGIVQPRSYQQYIKMLSHKFS